MVVKASNDSKSIFRTRVRGPLLRLLIPLMAGYCLGHYWESVRGVFEVGAAMVGVWLWAWWQRRCGRLGWKMWGMLGLVMLAWGYYDLRQPAVLDWRGLPEREAFLTLKVEESLDTKDKYGRVGGYATVVEAPLHLKALVGQRVYYFLKVSEDALPIVRRQEIAVRGILKALDADGSGFEQYLRTRGMRFQLYRGDVLGIEKMGCAFYHFCERERRHWEAVLKKGVPAKNEQEANVYVGMLLGKKGALNSEQKEAFRRTGSFHLFAISGLHVGVVAGCLAMFLRWLRVPAGAAAAAGLLGLFFYVEVTGAAPSAMRAFLMVCFYWGARVFLRKKSAFSALLGSAFMVLVVNPNELWNVGFQLSYSVVGVILLYGLPLNENFYYLLKRKFYRRPWVRKGLLGLTGLWSVSLAAFLGSAPFSVLYFNTFALGGIFLNMVLVPLASLVIVGGCVSLMLGLVGLSLVGSYVNRLCYEGIGIMEWIITLSLKVPCVFREMELNYNFAAFVYLGIFFFAFFWMHTLERLEQWLFYGLGVVFVFSMTFL